MKKAIYLFLLITSFCGKGYAQEAATLMLRDLTAREETRLAKRYKGESFAVPNAEGQILFYHILPEGNNTVAVVDDEKSNRYEDAKYIIPENITYNGQTYKVTEVANSAFYNNDKVTSVTFPSSIRYIGTYAFWNCRNLTEVQFKEGLLAIGKLAFFRASIAKVILPQSVRSVGAGAFLQYNTLQELSIPDGLRDIGKNAFGNWGNQFVGSLKNFSGLIHHLPDWITAGNCKRIGLSPDVVTEYRNVQLAKQQQQAQPQVIYVQAPPAQVAGTTAAQTAPATRPVPSSDVDKNIPETGASNENTFAIIIANENYQEEEPVKYALNDGQMFKTYCEKVLGLPEENIHYREDATLNNILAEVDWISKVAQAYQGDASLIVYYAGHGVPDEKSGTSYLLPVDGFGSNLVTGYSLGKLYQTLGELPVRNITVFMDACFSGAKRGEGMLASARGVAIKAKPETPRGQMVVFSAAQGNETAYPYEDKQHGLFTYYLLKKLQETKGDITLGELGDYLTEQVSRRSIVTNGKSQTPSVASSESILGTWKELKLK